MNLYREIAKKVHPDLSHFSDATDKMQEVNKYKDNPYMLKSLAIKWGLSIDGLSFDDSIFNKREQENKTSYSGRVYEAVVGAIVKFYANKKIKDVRGVIVKVRLIKRGRLSGLKEYIIYNFKTNSILTVKGFNYPNEFNIVGMADPKDTDYGYQKFLGIQNFKKHKEKVKQDLSDQHFLKLGLQYNFKYNIHKPKDVLINYSDGEKWKPLERTTKKSVYVWETEFNYKMGKSRRIGIQHVKDVRDSMLKE